MSDADLRNEINKRFTLNWLIQGAAQHAGMTFQHLVRDELNAIDPELIRLYDQYALINLLQYWRLLPSLIFGWPPRFWRRAASSPKHPFFGHPVLSRHGGMLAAASRERGLERCKEKGFDISQAINVITRLRRKETGHPYALVELAKKVVTMVWGIPPSRLDAQLATRVTLGDRCKPRTFGGRVFRKCVVGYGGVERRSDSLVVVGRGTNWQLVTKELVKGTAELICLHGLNRLTDETYQEVISAADGIDYEPWMLQTGGELWRRLLAVLPVGCPLAVMLMHLARMPAQSLETLMLPVIEQPAWASELLANLLAPGNRTRS